MESSILRAIDELIEQHKKENRNEDPLYIILSTDESKAVTEEIRKLEKYPEDQIITSYRDIKIAPHPSLLNGKRYVSNELPETGS